MTPTFSTICGRWFIRFLVLSEVMLIGCSSSDPRPGQHTRSQPQPAVPVIVVIDTITPPPPSPLPPPFTLVVTVDSTLPVPSFSPQGGQWPFATPVALTVNGSPGQGIIEYSVDGGERWTESNHISLQHRQSYMARLRVDKRISKTVRADFSVFFRRVLVVGNSIMSHAPDASIGWNNFCGMAASAPEKDFMHILTERLRQLNPQVDVRMVSGGDFERGYWTYNLDNLDESLRFLPDLVIVRIAENIAEGTVEPKNLAYFYQKLLEKVTGSASDVQVVCTTSFWNQPQANAVIRRVATQKGYPIAEISTLFGKPEYLATQYTNTGVAAHPNDAAMQKIADLIWQALQ